MKDHYGYVYRQGQRLLCAEMWSDLLWWSEFIVRWNGIRMILNPQQALAKSESDTSGKWAVWQHGKHTGCNGNGSPQKKNGALLQRNFYQYY